MTMPIEKQLRLLKLTVAGQFVLAGILATALILQIRTANAQPDYCAFDLSKPVPSVTPAADSAATP